MQVIKLWCEWDLGFPEIFESQETLNEFLSEIDWNKVLDEQDDELITTKGLEDGGLLGSEIVTVYQSKRK